MDVLLDFLKDNKQKLKPLGFFALMMGGLYGLNYLFKVNDEQGEQQEGQRKRGPAGIMNEGNTCFVNSLLQAMASVETFKSNIQNLLKVKVPQDDNEQLIVELNKVIKKINTGSQNISVMDLLDIVARTQQGLINFEQQDTYQLFSAIVRAFDEFFNKRKSCNLSISQLDLREDQIANCLLGYTKSTIKCLTCNNTMTIKNHSFYDLSLEIQPNFIASLKSALIWFERQQKISNYACTFCSVKAHIQKLERALARLNGYKWESELSVVCQKLITFLKKNTFEDMDMKQINESLEDVVSQFKDTFQKIGNDDFRNHIFAMIKGVECDIVKQTKITKYPNFLVIHFKQLIINPYTGEPAYMKKPIDFDTTLQIQQKTHTKIYKLTSLLTHIGNQNMGHYFTFRRLSKNSDDWFLISDTHTQKVSQAKMRRYVPYMLFYELVEEDYSKDRMAKSLRQNDIMKQKEKQVQMQKQSKPRNRLYSQIGDNESEASMKMEQQQKGQTNEQLIQESLLQST